MDPLGLLVSFAGVISLFQMAEQPMACSNIGFFFSDHDPEPTPGDDPKSVFSPILLKVAGRLPRLTVNPPKDIPKINHPYREPERTIVY